ncbi:hypothetical protein A3C23_04095 [Candidatus Roizmanbacteria bacterium RIFCSPHIGHO2_02_FULL_37_13b]|uniref:C2H2-type domain-containing protein n=1 Tax=Candidatus Roizmanbacteria bacterium RIFCSPLOWO2_02_FULL_36_11 TaxID=1802071 RepID=A0A1F7JGZ6_9BACT|nr:MAG: hypothetical protein A3C23_04095 [Candidatus Roizmanbacteria bacterium RIFCSPHIGHO2_02_FULL_37_13b]OGK54897.1 MAG: hypothetical protein A3H78_00240 [Candidatus Roizmanbacteria bacterium RIFCSPLOWO2_02_FULL_36_11]
MKQHKLLIALLLVLFLVSSQSVSAHPGNTAADGCHYCRTNCDKWGVPWDERHCHGGGSAPVEQPAQQVQEQPVVEQPTPYPTRRPIIPTRKPTIKPTRTPTPTMIPSPTLQPSNTPIPTQINEQRSVPVVRKSGFWAWIGSLFGKK